MKKVFISLVLFFSIPFLFAQNIKSMEFHNQNITDILLVLAEASGVSIIPDETVSGKASFYFSESSLEDALTRFLSTYNLYFEKKDNYITVSKIKISYNKETGLTSLKSDNVEIGIVLRKLSDKIGKTILYDTLPSASISLDINNLSVPDILEICIKKYHDYSVETTDSYYYVKRNVEKQGGSKNNSGTALKKNGSLYTLNLDKGRFLETLTKLFNLEQVEYSLFVQADTQL